MDPFISLDAHPMRRGPWRLRRIVVENIVLFARTPRVANPDLLERSAFVRGSGHCLRPTKSRVCILPWKLTPCPVPGVVGVSRDHR